MLRKIKLHGRLGKKFGREFEFDVSTVGDGVRALCALVPGFMEEMRKGSYSIRVRGNRTVYFNEHMINLDLAGATVIHLTPRPAGAKNGGIGKFILGALILTAAIVLAPVTGGTSLVAALGQTAFLGISFGTIALLGATIMLSGLALMLSPMPKVGDYGDREERPPSLMFNGAINTREQGGAVPLVYGEVIVGSVMISAGLVSEDVTAAPLYPYINPNYALY